MFRRGSVEVRTSIIREGKGQIDYGKGPCSVRIAFSGMCTNLFSHHYFEFSLLLFKASSKGLATNSEHSSAGSFSTPTVRSTLWRRTAKKIIPKVRSYFFKYLDN